MRIKSLRLEPYGCFERVDLALSESVTVVFGANESGKTTLLNAYTDLLCGIPRTTPMVALAPRPSLRLHAQVLLDGGGEIRVTRTPSSPPNDVVDAETSAPLPSGQWTARLGPLDHETLLKGFGIDHERLVQGGKRLMSGSGDLAELIFESRSGQGLREAVAALEKELASLFRSRGNSTSPLGDAVAHRGDVQRQLDQVMATATEVDSAQRDSREARERHAQGARSESEARAERDRLRGLIGSWNIWLEYRALSNELHDLAAEGGALSDVDLVRFEASREQLTAIILELKASTEAAAAAEDEVRRLEVDDSLLAELVVIKAIERDRGSAAEAGRRAAALAPAARTQRQELGQLIEDLGGDRQADPVSAYGALKIAPDDKADLDAQADEFHALRQALYTANDAVKRCQDRIDEAIGELRELEAAAEPGAPTDSVDLSSLEPPRQAREELWGHVRASWLDETAPPPAVAETATALANAYEQAVTTVDLTSTQLLHDLGDSAAQEREAVAALAKRRAHVDEGERALTATGRDLAHATQRLEVWQDAWRERLETLSLASDLGAPGWATRSKLLSSAAEAVSTLRGTETELAAHLKALDQWEARVGLLASTRGAAVDDDSRATWFDSIREKALESEANRKAAQIHRQQADQARERAAELLAERQSVEGSLDHMAQDLGSDRHGMKAMADRATRRRALHEERDVPAGQLRARHLDVTLTALIAELSAWEKADLDAALVTAESRLDTIAQQLEDLHATRLQAQQLVTELTGRRGAEELAQDLALADAQIEDLAERWAVARLKLHLLTTELESYFAGHANPVLQQAGVYLESLTDGRYVALRIDTDGSARTLTVIGANGNDYQIGDLSEGTCTQVYLALRLGGLVTVQADRQASCLEVLPIVLDDILMPFDDTRTAHALATLAEIGRQFQIVVLTHHQAVATAAAAQGGGVSVVELPPASPMFVAVAAPVIRDVAAQYMPATPGHALGPSPDLGDRPRPPVCIDCGGPIAPTGKRGRPPKRCASCRGL